MRIHYLVRYLSFNAAVDQSNVPARYWDARMFTRAVKYGTINGYCHVPTGFFRQRIDQDNVGVARQMFGRWVLSVIQREIAGGAAALVPVPSTDAVRGAEGPFRSAQVLTDALPNPGQHLSISDILRFRVPVLNAARGGPRFADQIYPLLVIQGEVPNTPIILVDDIATSAGHLRAAKRRLQESGGNVAFGIVCGRTVQDTDGDAWQSGSYDVDDAF